MATPGEIDGPLAERYCDFLDLLEAVDLDALDRRIDRLTRLRDSLQRMRRADPVVGPSGAAPTPAPPTPPAEETTRRPRRPNGFWAGECRRILETAGRQMTARDVFHALRDEGVAIEVDRAAVHQTLANVRHVFRQPPGTDTWELIPPPSLAETA